VSIMNGDIHIDSQVGEGTSIAIQLYMEKSGACDDLEELAEGTEGVLPRVESCESELNEENTPLAGNLISSGDCVLDDGDNVAEEDDADDDLDRDCCHRQMRILVVEDNRVNMLLATRFLESMGHKVVNAVNGQEALDMLKNDYTRQLPVHMVLMDIQMPVMDGVEAVKFIRAEQDSGYSDIPIYALTAHAMKGDKEHFMSVGMDGYLTKPLDFKELKSIIAEVASSVEVLP